MLTLSRLSFEALLIRIGDPNSAEFSRRLAARGLKVSDQAVRQWKSGAYKPHLPPDELKILCEELRCTFDELVEAFGSD